MSSKEDIEAFNKIYDREDAKWVKNWLEHKELHDWAEVWQEKYGEAYDAQV